jgi:hypothetical protein
MPADPVTIYAVERGWHTDIGLPVSEITGPLATLTRSFPGVHFLTFGFGDRDFVLARRTTLGGLLGALFPSPGAVLMTALRAPPEAAFGKENVVALRVSRDGFERMTERIWQTFELAGSREPTALGDGPYPGSRFYAAAEEYDAFNTCNTWTARILNTGGLPMPIAGMLFVDQIMEAVRRISMEQDQRVTVEPGGATTVLDAGGGGLLLLNVTQPPKPSGSRRANRTRRILVVLR